jgi:hypothetical protein
MKRIIIFLIAFISFYDNLYSQQYYDNGPIIENRGEQQIFHDYI